MSQSEQFRQYAEEALLSVQQSKDQNEIKALIDLAHVWVLAAFESERAEGAYEHLWPRKRTSNDQFMSAADPAGSRCNLAPQHNDYLTARAFIEIAVA